MTCPSVTIVPFLLGRIKWIYRSAINVWFLISRPRQAKKAAEFHLSLSPFRQVVKDYWAICESYYDAVKNMPPSQIETIDMARRGIHNEGARVLSERLEGKAIIDNDTARRLFTLICVLHFGA